MSDTDSMMGTAKISTAVRKMAVPSVISSLVTVIYNMADTFFVGQTHSSLQVAAVSLTNPIFILMMAFANMLGMGGSAVISIALGQKKEEAVKKTSAFVTAASILIGLVIMLILLVFIKPILTLFGANKETYGYAHDYVIFIAIGAPFIIWSAAASFIVRSEGSSKEAMYGSMIGTIANIILDPLFITTFHMGAGGAAIATTIANIMASAYYLWYFLKKTLYMSIALRYTRHLGNIPPRVAQAGLPMAIFSALMSVSTIVLNQILVKYGNDAVAAIGIVFKAQMFVTFIQTGIANGIQPLLGYAYGAKNEERFKATEHYTLAVLIITGIISTAFFILLRRQIISLFINDEGVIKIGVPMLVGYVLSGPFVGILFLNMNCMQSTDHAFPATMLSILRQGVMLIPLLYLLDALFGMRGVYYGQSLTDLITTILSVILWHHFRKNVFKEKAEAEPRTN